MAEAADNAVAGRWRARLPNRQIALAWLLVLIVMCVMILAIWRVVGRRTEYFQRRDLYALEKIGTDIDNVGNALGKAALVHFDPDGMTFSTSANTQCLVAKADVPAGPSGSIAINYFFVDPTRADAWLDRLETEDDRAFDKTAIDGKSMFSPDTPPAARALGAARCALRRPIGGKTDPALTLTEDVVKLQQTYRLARLLAPIVDSNGLDRVGTIDAVKNTLKQAAARQLGGSAIATMPTGDKGLVDPVQLANASIDSAFASNSIYIEAEMTGQPIGAREIGRRFDAVLLFSAPGQGGTGPDRRRLLWRLGEVPPLLDRSDVETADKMLAGFIGGTGLPTVSDHKMADRDSYAPVSASAARIGNLIIYQRDFTGGDGLGCSIEAPCKLVAVREGAHLDSDVRKLDGIQATWLLIAVLTILSLLPLIRLMLGKRLDPLPRSSQYLTWLALSLLSANAVVAGLTLYSSGESLAQGKETALALSNKASRLFADELAATVTRVGTIGGMLTGIDLRDYHLSDAIFPAPRALCLEDWRRSADAAVSSSGDGPAESVPLQPKGVMLTETIVPFATNGYAVPFEPRWNVLRAPSYGANVQRRDYFRRGLDDDFATLDQRSATAAVRKSPDDDAPGFIIDRVYSRPDGQPKTVLLVRTRPRAPAGTLPRLEGKPGEACQAAPAGSSPRHVSGATQMVIATGTLRTFLTDFRPQVGFRYAVVDPARARGPNVLFHSEPEAELTDRLENDIDDPGGFDDAMTRAVSDGARQVISTSYRAVPVRMWIQRLHPKLGWVIVIIEDRSQAGFAIYREALLSYLAWSAAMTFAILLLLYFVGVMRPSLDRSPGIWLWPNTVLADCMIQYVADLDCRAVIRRAPPRIAAHLLVSLLLVTGVIFAEGAAGILLAFTATAHVALIRAAFDGVLARDPAAGRRRDRILALLVAAAAGCTILATLLDAARFWFALPPDQYFTDHFARALFTVMIAAAGGWHAGWIYRRGTPDLAWFERKWPRRIAGALPLWAIALFLASAAPAIAGFFDGFSANVYWSIAADRERLHADVDTIQARLRGINRSLVPDGRLAWRHCLADDRTADCFPVAGQDPLSWAARSVNWLHYDRIAIETSQTPPPIWRSFRVRIVLPGLLATIILYCSALLAFRRQYFPAPPPRVIGSPGLTLANVAGKIARHAGQTDPGPFAHSSANRHLIVGIEHLLEGPGPLRDPKQQLLLFDLLRASPPAAGDKPARGIVMYNFDLATLRYDSYVAALQKIDALISYQETTAPQTTLFLLAATEPLDRIVSARLRKPDEDPATSPAQADGATLDKSAAGQRPAAPVRTNARPIPAISGEARWAEMLRPFGLYTVARPPAVPAPPPGLSRQEMLFYRELSVVRSPAAGRLMKQPPHFEGASNDDVVAFVTDNLAEHYRLFWETSASDEQVILFALARGRHLKMQDSFALRSLLLRGLIVRTPEYRIMNRSFRRFVQSAGNPRALREAASEAKDGTDPIWPLLRLPLAALVATGSALLTIVAPDGAGIAAILPAITASLPALFAGWFRAKPSA